MSELIANNISRSGEGDEEFVNTLLTFLPGVASRCTIVFAVLGVIGSCAVVCVYNWNYSPNASETIITLYSITDGVFVILNCIFVELDIKTDYMTMVNYALFGFTLTISLLITNLINVNRYMAICHPTLNKQYFTKPNVTKILIVLVALSSIQGVLNGAYVYLKDWQLFIDYQFFILLDMLVLFTIISKIIIYTRCYVYLKKHDKKLEAYDQKSVTAQSMNKSPAVIRRQETLQKQLQNQEQHEQKQHQEQPKGSSSTSEQVMGSPVLAKRKVPMNLFKQIESKNQKTAGNNSSDVIPAPNSLNVFNNGSTKSSSKKTVSVSCSSNLNTAPKPTGRSGSKHSRTRAVTTAFFCVSFFFIISVTPLTCSLNYENLIAREEEKSKTFRIISVCCRIIFLFHFITNPIIYMVTNASFRLKLLKDLKSFWRKISKGFRPARPATVQAKTIPQIQVAPPSTNVNTSNI